MKNSKFIIGILTLGAFIVSIVMIATDGYNITDRRTSNTQNMAATSSAFVEEQIKKGKKPNRLISEKSPYLLQHAFNPVDWYPWGEEAFKKAKKEDKPIFLSIGYSTCYWCHVMEREVFEDTAIARLMNEQLICIKVDREERPDIDRVYMTAVQAITGSGGWPMSIFMTPERQPFFGGTYIPPRAQYGRPGFPDLVNRIVELWRKDRSKINESSRQITELLQSRSNSTSTSPLSAAVSDSAYQRFLESYDYEEAGFGGGPKFPRPVVFNFLLRYYFRTGQDSALNMTLSTLRAMRKGGMYDHIGGGFHRYSVDGKWRVPHFEKMLYDQAQLAVSYLEAYQITHDEFFASTARDVLAYVAQKLKGPNGGFYSAEDAESALDPSRPEEKEEGTFYLWTTSEIEKNLGADARIFKYYYGAEDTGNALQDPQRVFIGKNILYIAHSEEETATHFHTSSKEVSKILADARAILYSKRELRPHPHLDDKIITAWNGLMISAFAKAFQVLHDEEYKKIALQSAEFVMSHAYDAQNQMIFRRYRDGEARYEGGLEDYAFLTKGLIDLYEATFEERWLDDALRLTKKQIELFNDSVNGGFYDISGHDATILTRTKEEYDGAEPAGNSIAVENLLRLAQLTDNNDWRTMAEKAISSFGRNLALHPDGMPQMLAAFEWNLLPSKEIIVAGNAASADTKMLLDEVHSHFIPNKILALIDPSAPPDRMTKRLPFTADMRIIDGKAAAYICENYACQLPTTDRKTVAQLLTSRNHRH